MVNWRAYSLQHLFLCLGISLLKGTKITQLYPRLPAPFLLQNSSYIIHPDFPPINCSRKADITASAIPTLGCEMLYPLQASAPWTPTSPGDRIKKNYINFHLIFSQCAKMLSILIKIWNISFDSILVIFF